MSPAEKQARDQKAESQMMIRLLDNEDFQHIIMSKFIKEGTLENALKRSLDNDLTIDELKARQILHTFLFDIITVEGS